MTQLPFLLVAIILGTSDVGFTRDFATKDMCDAAREQILRDLGPALEDRHASIRCVLRELPGPAVSEVEQRQQQANLAAMMQPTPAPAESAPREQHATGKRRGR